MTSREFCYWLQGHFEIVAENPSTTSGLTATQVDIVRKHLAMVFLHEIDPSYPNQTGLNKLHSQSNSINKDTLMRC